MNIKISIIVPIFNAEKYISECLESLINQTYRNIEIILIDDGSPDKSGDICDSYSKIDNRIKVIHKSNEGVSVARNIGIENATGEWIIFVDPDDWCTLDMCEKFVKVVSLEYADIYLCNNFVNYETKEEKNSVYYKATTLKGKDKESLILQLLCKKEGNYFPQLHNCAGPWGKMYSKEFINKNSLRFKRELRRAQDNIFNLYAFENACKIKIVDEYLYHYRMNSESVWGRYSPDIVRDYEKIFKEIEIYIKRYDNENKYMDAYYAKVVTSFYSYMRLLFFHKNNKCAYGERKEELSKLINKEPYNKALSKVKYEYLNKQEKVFVYLLKHKFYDLLFVVYKAKLLLNSVR